MRERFVGVAQAAMMTTAISNAGVTRRAKAGFMGLGIMAFTPRLPRNAHNFYGGFLKLFPKLYLAVCQKGGVY